jgi:hypothetical protein
LTSLDSTLCAPHSRQNWRETSYSDVTARIETFGCRRAMRAAVVPLDVNATMAEASIFFFAKNIG